MIHRYRYTVVGVMLVTAILLAACATDKTAVVDAYRTAYNAGDVDGVMSLMADDAVFHVIKVFDLEGKEAIRNVAEYDTTLHLVMAMRDLRTSGDTVSCMLIETNDWLELTGIDSAVYSAQFVVEGGAITAIRAESSPSTATAMARAMVPMMGWALGSQPDEFNKLIIDGRMLFNADNAHRIMRLTRASQAAIDGM